MGSFVTWSPDGGGDPIVLAFDVVTSEAHDIAVQITEHPVETGSDIADNARPELDHVTLEAFVTQTPLGQTIFSGPATTGQLDLPQFGKSRPLIPPLPVILAVKQWNNPLPLIGFETVEPVMPSLNGPQYPVSVATSANVLTFANSFDAVQATLDMLRQLRDTSQIVQVFTPQHIYSGMLLESAQLTRDSDTGTGGKITASFKQIRIVSSTTVNAPSPVEARGNGAISTGGQSTKDAANPAPKQSILKYILDHTGFHL